MKIKEILISDKIKQFVMVFAFGVLLIGIFISSVYLDIRIDKWSGNIIPLNNKWFYVNEYGINQEITLPTNLKSNTNTPISITRKLPITNNANQHFTICFRTSQQDVNVYLDDKIIYHYDSYKQNPFGKASFSKWNFVELPQGFEGKEITISVNSPYNKYRGKFNTIAGGHDRTLYSQIVREHLLQYITGILFSIVGLLFCVVCIIAIRKNPHYKQFGDLGFLMLLIGLWLYSECKMPRDYMFIGFAKSFIGHNAMLLMPLPIIMYVKRETKLKEDKFLSALFYFSTTVMIVVNILQFARIYDYLEMLTLTHISLLIATSCGAYYLCKYSERKLNNLEKTAFYTCILSFIMEFVRYACGYTNYTGNIVQLGVIVAAILIIISEINKLIDDAKQTAALSEQLKSKQEYIISSQMKPHFVYNALGAIGTMIYTSPDDAYKAMDAFTKYIRANIGDKDFSKLISFSQELEHIKAYCDIEHYRFGERIKVIYKINVSDFYIPPISIQPLVENAIKHGVFPKGEGGTVIIETTEDSTHTIVKIIDDGRGFEPSKAIKDTSLGLENINYRLEKLCNANVEIKSALGMGTIVTVRIPKGSNIK